MTITRRSLGLAAPVALSLGRRAMAQETAELRMSSLEGFGFLPFFIALDRHLIEFARRRARSPRFADRACAVAECDRLH